MKITNLGERRWMDNLTQAGHYRFRQWCTQRTFDPVTLDGTGMTDRTAFLGLCCFRWYGGHQCLHQSTLNSHKYLDSFANPLTCDQWGKARDLVAQELALTDEFANYGDQLAFALIFFKQQNAAWRVQGEIQQLLPSRLRALHDASRAIARAADLIVEDKQDSKPVQITASTFKNFSSASEKASEDTLRNWLAALFANQPVNYRHFLHCLVAKLLDTSKRNADLQHWMTRQAWGLYRYACLTQLIIPDPITEHPAMSEIIPNSAHGRYVREHNNFFRRPELIVAFLTGCYAAQVASVQRQERGADPFTKKFIGRLLSRQHLQRLYREGHGKLAQYGKLSYVITSLDPDLANAWVACGDGWAISDEEATFAFTIGYSLAYRINQLENQKQ